MCVLLYVCTEISMYVCTCVRLYVRMYGSKYVCTCVRIHVYTCERIYLYVCLYIYKHVRIYVCMCTFFYCYSIFLFCIVCFYCSLLLLVSYLLNNCIICVKYRFCIICLRSLKSVIFVLLDFCNLVTTSTISTPNIIFHYILNNISLY